MDQKKYKYIRVPVGLEATLEYLLILFGFMLPAFIACIFLFDIGTVKVGSPHNFYLGSIWLIFAYMQLRRAEGME